MFTSVPKGPACMGCPAHTSGATRSCDLLNPSATLTVLYDNPSSLKPGLKTMWDRTVSSGLPVNHVCLTRCSGAQWLKGADRDAAMNTCRAYDVTHTPRTLVAGRVAWSMLHPSHIRYHDWLGFISPYAMNGSQLMATLTPRDLFDTDRIIEAKAHLHKLARASWPEALPDAIHHDAALHDLRAMTSAPSRTIAIDTEFEWAAAHRPGQHPLTMLGLAYRVDEHPVILQFTPTDDWSVVLPLLTQVVARHTIVYQNAAADVPVLAFNGGPVWSDYACVEDLMLAHASLYAGWPHDLQYLRSIGSHTNVPKIYREAVGGNAASFHQYNAADVYETLCIWEDLSPLVRNNAGLTRTYRTLVDLVPIHTEATARGVWVNKAAVVPALQSVLQSITAARLIVETYTGGPVPITGRSFTDWLVQVERVVPVRDKFTKKPTWNKDAITTLRSRYVPVDVDAESHTPLTVDAVLARIDAGAHPMLEARALYSRAFQIYTHYILPLLEGPDGLTTEPDDATETD